VMVVRSHFCRSLLSVADGDGIMVCLGWKNGVDCLLAL
jgi:hypothetical protein